MKTTTEVIKAVQYGEPVSELELKCAIIAMNYWKSSFVIDLARTLVDIEDGRELSDKNKKALKRAWESMHQNFNKDLDKFVMGSSYEPGISREEKMRRFSESVASGANKLLEVLTAK